MPSSVTVIKDCRGDFLRNATQTRISPTKYFLNFVVEIQPEILPKTDNLVGIDLDIKTFATVGKLDATSLHETLNKRINK